METQIFSGHVDYDPMKYPGKYLFLKKGILQLRICSAWQTQSATQLG